MKKVLAALAISGVALMSGNVNAFDLSDSMNKAQAKVDQANKKVDDTQKKVNDKIAEKQKAAEEQKAANEKSKEDLKAQKDATVDSLNSLKNSVTGK